MNTKTTSKGETWSRGTNSRLPFDINVNLNLSIKRHFPDVANVFQIWLTLAGYEELENSCGIWVNKERRNILIKLLIIVL